MILSKKTDSAIYSAIHDTTMDCRVQIMMILGNKCKVDKADTDKIDRLLSELTDKQHSKVTSLFVKKEFIKSDEEELDNVTRLYGKKYTIEKNNGTRVDLTKLANNQRVCSGGYGKRYHFLLTEK